jgi:hypothetical protein
VQRFAYEPDKAYPYDASVEFWSHGPGDFFAWGRINSLSPILSFVEAGILAMENRFLEGSFTRVVV